MKKEHSYSLTVKWTGNTGKGTEDYRSYERAHTIEGINKTEIQASSDPAFRGDKTKYNPEELLLASLSSCHMLWFLHLCADSGIVVVDYVDKPEAIMVETDDGSGKFNSVTLNPVVTVKDKAAASKLREMHDKANKFCFIANSVNFPVKHNYFVRTV